MSRARDLADSADLSFDGSTLSIDSTNNRVGIGTTSPSTLLELDNGGTSTGDVMVFNLGGENREHSFENYIATGRDLRLNTTRDFRIRYGADTATFPSEGQIIFEHGTNGEAARIDSSANLKFNSGYGSVATAYGCRAWVNFDGTGTVAIRASGNVSSITDNGGTGDYTVNFTTAMPDANYGYSLSGSQVGADCDNINPHTLSTGSLRFQTFNVDNTSALRDYDLVSVAIFR